MKTFAQTEPRIDESVFIADTATVIGDVKIGPQSSVWYSAVIRADSETVRIGRAVSVQDGVVIHESKGAPVEIGDNVTIGHRAVIHGCTIGSNVIVGMGSIILNGAKIGNNCIIGAGALVTGKTEIPDGSLVLGAPAKAVKQITPAQEEEILRDAQEYVQRAAEFKAGRYAAAHA